MLTTKKSIENGTAVFALEGSLDTFTAPVLEEELKTVMDGLTDLTFDLAGLDYISSMGLRVILSTQKIMNKQGKMKVTNVCETVMEIFEITGFSDILTIDNGNLPDRT